MVISDLYDYNCKNHIYDKETRLCSGSGYCRGKVKITINSARLSKKTNIKQGFLNDISSDEEPVCETRQKINNYTQSIQSTSIKKTKNKK